MYRLSAAALLPALILLSSVVALPKEIATAPPALAPDLRYKADLLLVIAHPDDDTAVGAFLARLTDEHKRVAVIYCTPGDGGGNQVGNEAGRSLGQIRILEARRALASLGIENVWFLGAHDTPGQNVLWSLDNWGHGRMLEEVVRLMRLTRPEVVLTWFPDNVAGENHGDHHAAGILATEAFDLAGDRTRFAEQVSPARNRTGMMNYTEGLLPWQPKKLYYTTDSFENFMPYWHDPSDRSPFRHNFLDGQGPSYSATDMSSTRHKPYSQLAAEELTFFRTQDGKLAQQAITSNDYHNFEFPVRLVLGKSLVGGSATGDVFEGITDKPLPFVPTDSYHPSKPTAPLFLLGDPWLFYRQFWQVHNLTRLSALLPVPETSAGFGEKLYLPMLIENPGPEQQEITVTPALPSGWIDQSPYQRFVVPPGQTVFPQMVVTAPAGGKRQWQELKWQADSKSGSVGTVTLRVYVGKGSALPQ